MRCKLLDKTMELLLTTDKSAQQICREADVGYPWLMALKGGHNGTKFPAVDKIERLYECLAGRELKV
jgi:hypothetical protein